jgi:hypothetical protein
MFNLARKIVNAEEKTIFVTPIDRNWWVRHSFQHSSYAARMIARALMEKAVEGWNKHQANELEIEELRKKGSELFARWITSEDRKKNLRNLYIYTLLSKNAFREN